MNFLNGRRLNPIFETVAFSGPGFAAQRAQFSLRKMFMDKVGLLPNWAIDRDIIIPKLREILPQRHMTQMNAAAFLCALSLKHVHSSYDPVRFLGNFLKLYNAKSFDEVCQIEEIIPGSPEWIELNAVRIGAENVFQKRGTRSEQLEAIKIRCWAKDLEKATSPNGKILFNPKTHKSITVKEVEDLLRLYPSYIDEQDTPQVVEKLRESDGSLTNSAFPKDDYLPMLRDLRAKGYINETQCGIILCFILHSRERRNDKKTSYVTHPMAVANLVRNYGERYLADEGHVWMATLAALLHDGGEKSNINLEKDLEGLLPQPTIEAIKALHKRDDESYFDYLERCADNPLAATVKICDIYHNSSDAGTNPGFKQTYVYPIAAAYVQYRLTHKDEKLSVADFIKRNNICSAEKLDEIEQIAAHKTDKKKPASTFRDRLALLNNLGTISDIFKEEIIANADTRREEKPSLHP